MIPIEESDNFISTSFPIHNSLLLVISTTCNLGGKICTVSIALAYLTLSIGLNLEDNNDI